MKRSAIILTLLIAVITGAAVLHSQSPDSVPGKLDQILAKLEGLLPQAKTTTALLFPFATNQAGFDTGLSVSNIGDVSGSCVINFFGANAPAPLTVPLAARGQYVNVVSVIAPNFQGFVRVNCDFPTAHGWGFVSDLGTRNLGIAIPVEILD